MDFTCIIHCFLSGSVIFLLGFPQDSAMVTRPHRVTPRCRQAATLLKGLTSSQLACLASIPTGENHRWKEDMETKRLCGAHEIFVM